MKSLSMLKSMKKEKGFTLLELLVVITLLAVLSVGAILAYDGVGNNAFATSAALNTATSDQSLRNYKAVTFNFPNQWDNLTTTTGAPLGFAAAATNASFVPYAPTAPFRTAIAARFDLVGVDELQVRVNPLLTPGEAPNLQHNEGAMVRATGTVAAALLEVRELDFDDALIANYAALPSAAGCQIGGDLLPVSPLVGPAIPLALQGAAQNIINDDLGLDECHLVMAFGFGNDVAASTTGSPVAIATAPTFTSRTINPAVNYARYIALFHVGDAERSGLTPLNVELNDLFDTPRLLAVVDTAGNVIETNRAAANVR